jgi:tetratricopeptide (TPR) repeat protein
MQAERLNYKAARLSGPFGLLLLLALVLCAPQATAQTDAAGKALSTESSSQAASTPTTQTRARRTAPSAPSSNSAASVVDDNPDDKPLMIGEAKETGRLSSLRAQIADAKTSNERTRLQRMLIDYLVALNKKNEAVAELRVMMSEERIDPVGFYNIGNALARLGDTDTAIDAYRKAVNQRHGNYARAHNNLGVMLLRQGRWDEALETFVTALRLENFRYGEASYNLGRVYGARGEADLAIKEWNRTLVIEPDHMDAAIALARAYAEDGSPERGLAVLDKFIARKGPSQELTTARNEILFVDSAGETANSGARANAATSQPASVKASATKTVSDTNRRATPVKSESGKRSASLRSLTVDQETYDLLERARAAREGGRNEEAVTFYRRVLSRSYGFFPPANLEMSFVLSKLKRHEEAAASLATLTKREGSRYPIAYYHLGRQYEQLGRFQLAAEAFEKAAALYSDENPQFLLDLSRTRDKEGNAEAALAAMEEFVRISKSKGRTLDWSEARLAELRQKVAASKPAQAPK